MSMRALKLLTRKARPYTRDQGVQYFVKNGDLTTAMKDFKSINPKDIRKYATVRCYSKICHLRIESNSNDFGIELTGLLLFLKRLLMGSSSE